MSLLVSIVVAGIIVVLTATILQSHNTVRFDRSFTQAVQVADAGVQEAYHRLATGQITLPVGGVAGPFTTTLGADAANWEITRTGGRTYEVVSDGTMDADGVARRVVVALEEKSLFFPGAFGDRLVAMNGTSTNIDSYESGTPDVNCAGNAVPTQCWGAPWNTPGGTGKGALGTNENFDFSGNVNVSRAILYDWRDNPPAAGTVTTTNPGGSRCDGNPCTSDVLRMEADRLDYGSDAEMQFIIDKLDNCDGHEMPETVLGSKKEDSVLRPQNSDPAANQGSPADPGWDNYWCADTLQINGDVVLEDASPETPVVIFLNESYKQNGHTNVNCPECGSLNMNKLEDVRSIRPKAGTLQIYVRSQAPTKGANVLIDTHSVFAGVVYAPRAGCGSSGNAGVHIYGAMICRRIDNVGNWAFHYDESLHDTGRGLYSIGSWREE
ncbi:MAG: hypothetical protein KG028_13455 [Actinobacteria bacterium]|nr:hypothetical protein [Actinomycetota bacterium]